MMYHGLKHMIKCHLNDDGILGYTLGWHLANIRYGIRGVYV